MYYFSSDHHFGHTNILKFCNRPFKDVNEMNQELIDRHNSIVNDNDMVIIIGDFSFLSKPDTKAVIKRMKGHLVFLKGSHDRWLKPYTQCHELWEHYFKELKTYITCCHYQMKTWPRSHYNSIQLYGHHHGNSIPEGKQMDIGVDTNDYYPYPLTDIINIMKDKPDNINLVKK